MLRLVTGRSGFGKTEWIYREIERYARETDESIMLLVPEQFSFETERTMLDRLGAQLGMRVNVCSFSRLAENTFRQVGGLCGERLTDGGKAVLMRLAISGLRDKLNFYAKAVQDTAFIPLMLSAVTEWKQACISPDDLHDTASKLSQASLKAKAEEGALIYEAYQALLGGTYLDPLDDLTKLRDALRIHKSIGEAMIFIDGFRSFTGQELDVLEELLIQSRDMYVSLCLDNPDSKGLGLFYPVEETARQLKSIARRNGIPVAPYVKLSKAYRFCNPELSTLEACAYRNYSISDLNDARYIEIYSAADPYEEADIVAESIHRYVRENKLRYSDFAIIARNIERYRGIIDTALDKYDIVYYMSKPERIDIKPLFTLVFSVLSIISDGFSQDEMFRYLKTGLTGLSVEQISDLENYTLLWHIEGSEWKAQWDKHPDGFKAGWNERDKEAVAELNNSREQVIEPILRLKNDTAAGNAVTISKAIYMFLMEIKADQALMAYEQRLADAGEHKAAQEQSRLWDILMELLDQMARTAGEMSLSVREYTELLRLMVSSVDISFIPQTQDSVIVGNADTLRAVGCRCVYLLGANEGQFPLTETKDGLFSDYERQILMEAGLPLHDMRKRAVAEERFYAYAAMTAPSQRLTVTYSRADASGTAQQPSSIVTEICRVFRDISIIDRTQRDSYRTEALLPAFEWTARHWREQQEPFPTLRAYFRGHPDFRDRAEAIERAVNRTPASLGESDAARSLFGNKLVLSPTQIDTYHRCRYRYFLRYGLNAKSRASTEVDPMTFGSVVHFVLENAVMDGRKAPGAYAADSERHARELVERYVELNMGGREGKSSRFIYLQEKMVRTVRDLILHIMQELEQSEFVPVDFELSVGADGEVPFPLLYLPEGGTVTVRGKVDRVDVMERNGKSYLRVVDYKTGGKEFSLAEVMDGLQVQMLLYLMCLSQDSNERYGNVIPAGVLYMPAKREPATLERDYTPEDLSKNQDKAFQMRGLLLDDIPVLRGMDKQLSGRYIPVRIGSNGKLSTSACLAALSDFGRIFYRIQKLIVDMGANILNGDLSAVPMADACEWCDYKAVCQRENGDPVNKPSDKSTQDILEELRKEENDEGESMDAGSKERH